MRRFEIKVAASAMFVFAWISAAAMAGPPLICHPIDIGKAESLPWGDEPFALDKSYPPENLVSDTLALLRPGTPVLVRMETLRRATIYADRHREVASKLLAAVNRRASEEAASDPLTRFDAGYLTQCYAQMGMPVGEKFQGKPSRSMRVLPSAYEAVTRANELRGGDPSIEFALAILTRLDGGCRYRKHLDRAIRDAEPGTLLARNLVLRMGKPGATLEDMKSGQVDYERF